MITKFISYVGALLIVMALFLMLTGCAHSMKAQVADSVTTAIALSTPDVVEGNSLLAGTISDPVGAVVIMTAKVGLAYYGTTLPYEECRLVSGIAFGAGTGAAISNILVATGTATGGWAFMVPIGIGAWLLYKHFGGSKHDCISHDDTKP